MKKIRGRKPTDFSTRAVLRRALRYLKAGWTQGTWARAANGREVSSMDARACRWCIRGALNRSLRGDGDSPIAAAAIGRIRAHLSTGLVSYWQDKPERTKAEVLAVVRRAIAGAP